MKELDELLGIIRKLRHPQDGCPWDLSQTSQSLVSNFIEELYETVEAIENKNSSHLKEELGDLMLHIGLQAVIAEEQGQFAMTDVLQGISEKLILRHPHIFGDAQVSSAQEVKLNWEQRKIKEKNRDSVLEGVPKKMPAVIVAQRIQEKAASVGFDWSSPEPVFAKITEETEEIKEAIANQNQEEIKAEVGDLLFSVINLARKLNVDAEAALRQTIDKFEYRFKKIEEYHKQNNSDIQKSTLEQLDEIWELAKQI